MQLRTYDNNTGVKVEAFNENAIEPGQDTRHRVDVLLEESDYLTFSCPVGYEIREGLTSDLGNKSYTFVKSTT